MYNGNTNVYLLQCITYLFIFRWWRRWTDWWRSGYRRISRLVKGLQQLPWSDCYQLSIIIYLALLPFIILIFTQTRNQIKTTHPRLKQVWYTTINPIIKQKKQTRKNKSVNATKGEAMNNTLTKHIMGPILCKGGIIQKEDFHLTIFEKCFWSYYVVYTVYSQIRKQRVQLNTRILKLVSFIVWY